jgi:hypothetical protein
VPVDDVHPDELSNVGFVKISVPTPDETFITDIRAKRGP